MSHSVGFFCMSYAALFFSLATASGGATNDSARAAGDYTTGAARDISQLHAASYIACAVSGAAQAG